MELKKESKQERQYLMIGGMQIGKNGVQRTVIRYILHDESDHVKNYSWCWIYG